MKDNKKILNKILSFVLSFIMIFSMILHPSLVMGEPAGTEDEQPITEVVQLSGSVKCGTEAVANASVIVKNEDNQYQTTSDNDGNFSVSIVKGTYNVHAEKEGFIAGLDIEITADADIAGKDLELSLDDLRFNKEDHKLLMNCAQEEISVENTVSGATFEWKVVNGDSVQIVSGADSSSVTVSPVKEGRSEIYCEISFGGIKKENSLNIDVEKVETQISFREVSPSEGTDVNRVTLSVDTTDIPNGEIISFYKNQTIYIGEAAVDSNSAAYTYISDSYISESVVFKAEYAGNDIYKGSSATSKNNNYQLNKPMKFVDGKGVALKRNSNSDRYLEQQYFVYGSEYSVKINEEVPNSIYSCEVSQGSADCIEASIDPKTGALTIKAKRASEDGETVEVVIKRTGNVNCIYSDDEVTLPLKINKKDVTITTDIDFTKTYDKAANFTVSKEAFKNCEVKGALESDSLEIISADIQLPSTDAGIYTNKNEITLSNIKYNNGIDMKYQVSLTVNAVCINVEQRIIGLRVVVDNVQREFGHKGKYLNDPSISIEMIEPALLDGDSLDEEPGAIMGVVDSTEDGTPVKLDADGNIIAYENAIIPDLESIKNKYTTENETWQDEYTAPNKNYKFSKDKNENGKLTIIKEKIKEKIDLNSSIIKQIEQYILFSDSNKESYYETQEDILWVRGTTDDIPRFITISTNKNENSPGSKYDSVRITEKEGITLNDSKNGVSFKAGEEDNKEETIEVTLYKEEVACSEPFEISVHVDAKAPEVALDMENKKAEQNMLDCIINKITFGYFGKGSYTVPIHVSDSGSGGIQWQYAVVNLKDKNKESDLQTIVDDLSDDAWSDLFTEAESEISLTADQAEGDGYVIFVRTYDNLDNSKIYASSGIVLENRAPDIVFEQGEEPYNIDKNDTEITQKFSIIEQGNIVSGIKSVKYRIYKGNGDNEKDFLVKETSLPLSYGDDETSGKLPEYSQLDPSNKESKYVQQNFEIKIKLDDGYNANDVTLEVIAEDFSGNKNIKTKNLLCDFTKPSVTVRYENAKTSEDKEASVHNGIYYDGNRTAIVTFSDVNLSWEKSQFNIAFSYGDKDYSFQLNGTSQNETPPLEVLKGLKDSYGHEIFTGVTIGDIQKGGTENKLEVKLTFNGEEHYKNIQFSCKDDLGNETRDDEVDYENGTEITNKEFVIDKTPPVVTVTYGINVYDADSDTFDQKNLEGPITDRVYTQDSVNFSVKVEERNFPEKEEQYTKYIKSETTVEDWDKKPETPDDGIQKPENWKLIQGDNSYNRKYEFTFSEEGNYEQGFTCTDLAGHKVECTGNLFTIDDTPPTGYIKIQSNIVSEFIDNITFGVLEFKQFFKNLVVVECKGEDKISPINTLQYKNYPEEKKADFIKTLEEWNDFSEVNNIDKTMTAKKEMAPNQQFVVYSKIMDKAGNKTYYSSTEGVVLDSYSPEIEIKELSQSQNGIFNENVQLQIDVEDPIQGDTYSGLEKVWYTVSASGNVNSEQETVLMDNSSNRVQGNRVFSRKITISAEEYNSNNVEVNVYATDFAGNTGESKKTLKIDVTPPVITVSWDLNDPVNGKYYKDTRTATVTVTERNFNPDDVKYNITNTLNNNVTFGEWTSDGNINVSDSAKSTCEIQFGCDGDYTFQPECTDLAGNFTKHETKYEFTIDKTDPEITLAYSNEKTPEGTTATEHNDIYYDGNRTATITFSDLNLSKNESAFIIQLEDLKVKKTYNLDKEDSIKELESLQDMKGEKVFSKVEIGDIIDGEKVNENVNVNKKKFIVTLTFNGEEHYSNIGFSCKDLAGRGNSELKYSGDTSDQTNTEFVIDKTPPELEVTYGINTYDINTNTEKFEELKGPVTNRKYTKNPVKYNIKVTERNFPDFPGEKNNYISSKTKVEDGDENPYTPDTEIQDSENWNSSQNVIKYEWTYGCTLESEGNYTQDFAITDLAGHKVECEGSQFTIDKTSPTGDIKVDSSPISELLNRITFGGFTRFFNRSVAVEFTGEDVISPVDIFQYKSYREQQDANLVKDNSGWKNIPGSKVGSGSKSLNGSYIQNPDQQFVTYSKIVDRAGNTAYYGSVNGVVLDTAKPGPKITITNLSQSQNGIFNEDVQLRIDVEDPIQGDTYSGLEKVWYTVSASGNVTSGQETVLMDNSSNRVQGNRVFSQTITIPAKTYNSNDVRVKAYATDFTGNTGESEETQLKIDVTNPSISVTWDLNNPANGKYYKDTRTATVTVTERNFDPNGVRFNITNTDGTSAQISRWSSSSNIGISDSATSTCTVSFPADGDYTFTLGCTDLAGNSVEYGQTDTFTIDKTIPVITVSYDNNTAKNGNYYKEKRTATVTVKEHNFNASDVKAAITANLQGQGITAPSVSGFSNSGDTHTATVDYLKDGDYTFDISYSDLAGNAAAAYSTDKFTVDLTPPDVQIVDIEDKSANNDVVAPGVTYTDINFEEKGAVITLMGANNGVVTLNQVQSAIPNGQSIKLEDFPHTEAMDDLYTYKVKVEDKAGNVTEKSVMFSVNRYGSVYVLDTETKKWLSTGEDDYTYINEEKPIGVIEYNVDTVDVSTLTSNRDGDLTNLEAGTDYKVKESGSEAQWKEYYYQIGAENFVEEGNYTLMISSQDKANNTTNNTSVKHAGKELPLAFTVDKTAPTVIVSGVEDGGQYRSAKRIMTVDAKDNLSLAEVEIAIDGKSTVYEAEELYETDGIISVDIGRSNKWQTIEIKARDAAGNDLGTLRSEDGELTSKSAKVVMTVLVTPNVLVQYYMNKPVFFGSLGVVVLAAALIILFILKRRKEEEGQQQV